MKVLQVCAYAAPFGGNFIASLVALADDLNQKGHETLFAFPENAEQLTWVRELEKQYCVFFLPLQKARIRVNTYIRLRKIIKENGIEIVHSHFELYDIPVSMVSNKNTKVLWHLHDAIYIDEKIKYKIFRFIQYRMLAKNSILVSTSEYYRGIAVKLGMPENKTYTLLNSLNLERIRYKNTNLYKHDFLVLGWDFHRKGGDIVLKACEELRNEGYNFSILYNGNSQTWSEMKKYVGNHIPDWLECVDPVEDVNELFEKCDTLISASRKETFSYAVCEAAYAGMHVISSDIEGLEWAKNLPSVSMFESENVRDLVNHMKIILKSNDKASDKDKVEQSRKIIVENFSIETWIHKIEELYGIT